MTRNEEISLVVAVMKHPAGFDLDFAGGLLRIRPTDQNTIEVEWEEPGDGGAVTHHKGFVGSDFEGAARFFVEKRHELEYGLDYERQNGTSSSDPVA